MGPQSDLDAVEKRQSSNFCRESNLDSSGFQPVSRRYTDWAIPAPGVRSSELIEFIVE
jgi:hypothetical protein